MSWTYEVAGLEEPLEDACAGPTRRADDQNQRQVRVVGHAGEMCKGGDVLLGIACCQQLWRSTTLHIYVGFLRLRPHTSTDAVKYGVRLTTSDRIDRNDPIQLTSGWWGDISANRIPMQALRRLPA